MSELVHYAPAAAAVIAICAVWYARNKHAMRRMAARRRGKLGGNIDTYV